MTRVGLVGYGSSGATFHAPLLRAAFDQARALGRGTEAGVAGMHVGDWDDG